MAVVCCTLTDKEVCNLNRLARSRSVSRSSIIAGMIRTQLPDAIKKMTPPKTKNIVEMLT